MLGSADSHRRPGAAPAGGGNRPSSPRPEGPSRARSSEDAAGTGSEPRRWHRLALAVSVFLLFYAYAVALQQWNGAFHAELSGESDEAAHFVTGLMAHDYVSRGFPGAPVAFARDFYLHYPKVAIGHWPPLMYVLLAAWMLFFPATIQSVIFLMALLAALLAYTLYRTVLREFRSRTLAILGGLLMLSIPLTERFGGLVMADLPVALWMIWATLAWARYLDTERSRHVFLFGLLAALAILTKGDGYLLVLLPLLTIPGARRWRLLRSPSLWLSAAFVAAVCLPWTIYTMKLVTPTMQSAPGWAFVARALPFYIFQLKTATGLLLFSLGLLGILVCFLPAFSSPRPRGLWFSMAALLIADVVFHAVVPAGLEPRYLISATFPVLLFAAEGARWLCRLPLPLVRRPIPVSAAALVFIVLFAAFPFRVTPKYSFGFAQAATDILADPTLAHSAVLCSSDRDGEGLLISEMAMRERRNGHYILRASKMLAVSDWNGSGYRLRLNTSWEINQLLDDLPVDVVVIDETPGVLHYQHNDLLLRAMEDPGWRLANVYPKTAAGMAPRARIEVYRRNGIAARSFDPNRLSFRDLVKSLE